MIRLNLPSCDIKLSGTREHPAVFDMLRRKYVALTPEEWVRQHFIHYLTEHLHYPASLLANEVNLSFQDKQVRADTVVYDNRLRPKMIVEYKAPHIAIGQKTFNQITTYNMLLHVDYLVVTNGINHYCCKMQYADRSYTFLKDIPLYENL